MSGFSDPPLELDRGDSDILDIYVTKIDGTPQDITGWTITITGKKNLEDLDSEAVLRKSTSNGSVTIDDAPAGHAFSPINPSDTLPLPNETTRIYLDTVGKDPMGNVNRLIKKRVLILPTVTETP